MTERGELTDEAKVFVVQALACFDTPSEVAKAVKAEFDATISRQAVEFYDPTKRAGRTLSAEYRAIFEATRAAFLRDTAEIGVSHRSVRLRTIQRLAVKAEGMGNLPLVADLLQQAAKEMGDAFTNRVALNHSGKVEVASGPDLSGLSADERAVMRELILKAEAKKVAEGEG